MENILKDLEKTLKKDKRLVADGDLLKNKIIELAHKLDKELIKLILSEKKLKKAFSVEVNESLIFDIAKFVRFISNKEFLPDSYTSFKNRIGLVDGDSYLSKGKYVVLAWPYKDCVLEGGMEKEDEKRDEIFYNETLAPDDIGRLFSPKVFTNFRRIDKDGRHEVKDFNRDEYGKIKDNLIIKGNNLLAVHSLKKNFKNKVKLIYIDPPFNRDADTFYNDSFKHSTWLTFMKNRLDIAKDFLRDDGVIFVHVDDNEQAYIKVLMDEVFGRDSFLNVIAVKMSEATGVKMSHVDKRFPKLKEYLIVYKNSNFRITNLDLIPVDNWNNEYKVYLENFEKTDRELISKLQNKESNSNEDMILANKALENVRMVSVLKKIRELRINEKGVEGWKFENSWRIVQAVGASGVKKYILNLDKIPEQEIASIVTKKKVLTFYKTSFDNSVKDPRIRILFADDHLLTHPGDFWQDIKTTGGVGKEGGVNLPKGKKPEKLIYRIIKMTTKPGDIVMDYHLGTGTTTAVAHKTGRQYIGIEQLDYAENDSVSRMENVINGEQSGISKAVNWKGGGSFIYYELMKWNEAWVDKIEKAKTKTDLKKLWKQMKTKAFLSYKVEPKKIDSKISEFEQLSLEDQKRFLMECIDKNYLYINYSEVDDDEYKISEEDKGLNKHFYE